MDIMRQTTTLLPKEDAAQRGHTPKEADAKETNA